MITRKWILLFLCFMFFNGVVLMPNMNINFEGKKFLVLSGILKYLLNCNQNIREVIINCDADQNLIKSFSDLESVTIDLFCNSKPVHQFIMRYQKAFVAAFDGPVNKVGEIMDSLKKSLWWNVMTPFFVISGSKNGCNDAEQVLKTVWKMNILNCYFVCYDSEQKPLVFTFNPYSKYAPDQWKTVREITEEFNYMAIYNRAYNRKNICRGLNFDRTKYLDKAALNLALCIPPSKVSSLPKLTEKNHHLIYSHFERDIFEMLKIGLKVRLNYNYDLEPFNDRFKPTGVYSRLLNKTSDVALCLCIQQVLFDFHPSHQIIYTGYSIFSKNRGLKTPLEKMYNFYGPVIIIATIITSTITYLVIWYVNKSRGHWFAIFEILRLWTSTSVYTKIGTLALRIFFAVIFIYFLIIQATFSGHLSKFLTNPELRYNAETLEDLQSSRYEKVYLTPASTYLVESDEILKRKSQITTVFEAIDAVLENESNALISIYMGLLVVFKRMNLSTDALKNYYLSNKFIGDSYFTYALRDDWPLTKKFNSFLILLEDTGNLLKLNNDMISDLESLLIPIELHPEFKPIDIESLLFIFYFLGIGLATATICFIIEKWHAKKNKSRTVVGNHI